MALVVKDRVQETSTTTGTGTLTLGGAVLGFQTFAIIGNANQTYYTIVDPTTGGYEVGIGTYTSSGTTLSRTTVLESSNSNSLVDFAAGTKNVFCTYPAERAVYLDTAGSAVTLLDVGTLGVSTANITTANITSGTVSTTPTSNTDIVNKQYADAIASGIHFHEAVGYATTAALPACTYNNGTSGVGATLTGNANGALTVDSYTFTSPADNGTRILIKNQVTQADNGVYTLSQAGNSSPGAPFILTRATDFDTVGTGVDQIDEGDFFLVTSGTANVNTAWVQQTAPPITIGTTAIVFQQFSAPITYTAGTGLSESPAFTFNIANTGTAGTYGSASLVPVFVTNAQGQVTSVTNTGIAIAAGAVSGLAASATTDTTDANNITSGTLGTSRLSGSYTGITGVGTLTAGTWNATAIGAVYGGTGQSSYAVGDLVYADTTTSLAKLADVAVGNALISGGVNAAPSYGKIGLATHVDGTLPTANGGTNLTGFTANGVVYASSSSVLATGSSFVFDGTNVGIGTATVNAKVQIQVGDNAPAASGNMNTGVVIQANTGQRALNMGANNTGGYSWINAAFANNSGTADNLVLMTGATERMRIDSSGNVGIGGTPSATGGQLQVTGAANRASARFTGNANGMSVLNQNGLTVYSNLSSGATDQTIVAGNTASTYMAFGIHNGTSYAERARIDASGNFLFNTTDNTLFNNTSGNGVCYRANASLDVATSSDNCLILNRMTSTGQIQEFRYAGAAVGNISTNGSTVTFSGTATTATTATALSTASGSAPSYSARAWVNFNGTGTPAIRASGNVSSITDNGTGNFTINFSTAMANANYGVNTTTGDSGNPGNQGRVSEAQEMATTSVRVRTYSTGAVLTDYSFVGVSIFR
jgi:hypothetical protein